MSLINKNLLTPQGQKNNNNKKIMEKIKNLKGLRREVGNFFCESSLGGIRLMTRPHKSRQAQSKKSLDIVWVS